MWLRFHVTVAVAYVQLQPQFHPSLETSYVTGATIERKKKRCCLDLRSSEPKAEMIAKMWFIYRGGDPRKHRCPAGGANEQTALWATEAPSHWRPQGDFI